MILNQVYLASYRNDLSFRHCECTIFGAGKPFSVLAQQHMSSGDLGAPAEGQFHKQMPQAGLLSGLNETNTVSHKNLNYCL